MSYFEQAAMTIAELAGQRQKRIESATAFLGDWVFEHLMEAEGDGEWGDMGIFKQEHLPRIRQMVAIGMMAQFEFDQAREDERIFALMSKDGDDAAIAD